MNSFTGLRPAAVLKSRHLRRTSLVIETLDEPTGADHLVETIPQSFVEAREQMSVTVEGQCDRRVTEALLDLLRVGSLRDQECNAGVPKVVEAIQRTMAALAAPVRAKAQVGVEP